MSAHAALRAASLLAAALTGAAGLDACSLRAVRDSERQHAQQNHLESAAHIGRKLQIAATDDGDLIEQLRIFRGQRGCQALIGLDVLSLVELQVRHGLQQRQLLQKRGQVGEHLAIVRRALVERFDAREHSLRVARDQRLDDVEHLRAIQRAEHHARIGRVSLRAAECDHLVEQTQRVAHAAFGSARHEAQRVRLEFELLRLRDLRETLVDQARRKALEVELQAARQHRHRQLLRIGGREQELDVRRRLLERLQQRVEGVRRQHVHFVDEVDLVAAARRRVLHVVEQLARVVDFGARGGVDFDQVDEAPFVDLAAGAALAAGRRRHAGLAVERLREDARDGGFAYAARAGEQERVVHAAGLERVDERAHDVFLAGQLGEIARPPFACESEIGHAAKSKWRRPAPAPLRRPISPLPLLPSGPGGVRG